MKVIGGHLTDCPPAAAIAGNGGYFRFLRKGLLIPDNFLSYVELKKASDSCCKAHALSLVPGSLNSVKRRVEEQPYFKKYGLAYLQLEQVHGKHHHDQENHVSWWRPEGLEPETIIKERIATLYSSQVAMILEGV